MEEVHKLTVKVLHPLSSFRTYRPAGIGTFLAVGVYSPVVAGFHRASPSTSLDKSATNIAIQLLVLS